MQGKHLAAVVAGLGALAFPANALAWGGHIAPGTVQRNAVWQQNSQGKQVNISPQVQLASGDNGNGLIAYKSGNGNSDTQAQANQDQGNLALQGNGSGA